MKSDKSGDHSQVANTQQNVQGHPVQQATIKVAAQKTTWSARGTQQHTAPKAGPAPKTDNKLTKVQTPSGQRVDHCLSHNQRSQCAEIKCVGTEIFQIKHGNGTSGTP